MFPEDVRLIEFISYEGNLQSLLWKVLYGELTFMDKTYAQDTLNSFHRNKWEIAPPVWVFVIANGDSDQMGDAQDIAKTVVKVTI